MGKLIEITQSLKACNCAFAEAAIKEEEENLFSENRVKMNIFHKV